MSDWGEAAFVDWQSLPRNSFGNTPELADELVSLILAGGKRATCWSAADGAGNSEVGGYWVVEDGRGRPRAVLQTVELRTECYSEIDEQFAADEGEGDLSLAHWHTAHRLFFANNGGFEPNMELWCERFQVVDILPIDDKSSVCQPNDNTISPSS